MWIQQYRSLAGPLVTLIMVLACLVSAEALGAARSQLSRWLSDSVMPDLNRLAASHPRLKQRSFHVEARGRSALDEAIAITLRESLLRSRYLQVMVPTAAASRQQHLPTTVDELRCHGGLSWDNELQVAVVELDSRRVEVQLDLVDTSEPGVAFKTWRWRGKLSGPEREYLSRPAQQAVNDGSMNAPWASGQLQEAAVLLSRQLACDLRPGIVRQVQLQWPDGRALPAPFGATVGEVRRLLGNYREIGEAQRGADYRLQVEWDPVRAGLWRLSLVGTPSSDTRGVVQAATYIEAQLSHVDYSADDLPIPALLLTPGPDQPASRYLQVEMLDVSQSDRVLGRAELRVRLRLVNRASRPIEFGLSLSGGHYLQCIPEPQFYRHGRYGYTEGRLAPGQSVVRTLAIDGVKHSPNPFFGPPKCAGFRGLEGLEDFANEGHRVTRFIRWTL